MANTVDTNKDYLGDFVHNVINGLPRFVGALVILIIGYIVAKVIASATRKLLNKVELNRHLHAGKGGNVIQRAVPDPSGFIAKFVYWVVFLFTLSIAVSALGIPFLVDFVRAIYGYLPNVIAAILIFLVASAVSAGIVTLVANTMGDTPTGKIVASAAPVLVMGLAVFMILNQLKIAPAIVTLTYGLLLGGVSLGMAIAFGLGGRDVAARILQNLYETSQQQKGQVAADVRKGASTAKQKGSQLRDQI